jgi:hypothetical protein
MEFQKYVKMLSVKKKSESGNNCLGYFRCRKLEQKYKKTPSLSVTHTLV